MKSLPSNRRQDKIGYFARYIRLRPKKKWTRYGIICNPCSKLHYFATWITKIIIKGILILSVEILRNWPILPSFSFLLFADGRVDGKTSQPSGVTGAQQKAWGCADQEWVICPDRHWFDCGWDSLQWGGRRTAQILSFILHTQSPNFILLISFAKGITLQWIPSRF